MAILSLAGCDMKKNTWFNRKHQALNTKYNVYYNANESFKKGNKRIEEAFQPDYSHVIPVFAVSDASTKGAGTGDMNKAVEKCELAIQKRSMQKKPKKDYSKMHDPNYVTFYNQEEFNSYMDDVYMLMGKSKLHANDYLAASATFTYVIKHFSHDKRLVTEASIWKARAMKEMDWIYEADEILKRIDPEIQQHVLDEIDDQEYLSVLRPLLKQKRKSIKAQSDYELNQKLVRFALSRGFTFDIIRQCLDVDDEMEYADETD